MKLELQLTDQLFNRLYITIGNFIIVIPSIPCNLTIFFKFNTILIIRYLLFIVYWNIDETWNINDIVIVISTIDYNISH